MNAGQVIVTSWAIGGTVAFALALWIMRNLNRGARDCPHHWHILNGWTWWQCCRCGKEYEGFNPGDDLGTCLWTSDENSKRSRTGY